MAELECFYTIPTHHTAPGWICHRRGSTPRCNRTNTITSSNEHTVGSSLSSFNPCDDSSPPDFVPAVGTFPPVPSRILPGASGWWWETASLPVKGSQRVFTISQPVPLSTLYRTHRCLVVIVTSLLLRTVLFSFLRQVRQLSPAPKIDNPHFHSFARVFGEFASHREEQEAKLSSTKLTFKPHFLSTMIYACKPPPNEKEV